VNHYCDIDYDVFEFMELNDYKYGFTMSLHEYRETIPTLWDETKVHSNSPTSSPIGLCKRTSAISRQRQRPRVHLVIAFPLPPISIWFLFVMFLREDKGETYNGCHFVHFLLLRCN